MTTLVKTRHDAKKPYYEPGIHLLSVALRGSLRTWHPPDLCVSFWRLYWNMTPGATIQFEGETFRLTQRRVVLVPPYTVIQIAVNRPVIHFYTHFTAAPPFDQIRGKVYALNMDSAILRLIRTLIENDPDSPRLTLTVQGLIQLLLARIPDTDTRKLCSISAEMAESLAFIEAHLDRHLSNQELARQLGVSTNTMLRKYHREIGVTPHRYVQRKRIEKACILLQDSRRSIEQIAVDAGFCDRYYFSRAFKKVQGMSPCQYRLQLTHLHDALPSR